MTIRSSIYLQGNKYKLFNDIKPHLDCERKTLVDVFGGSGCVTLNSVKEDLFGEYVYNDKAKWLFELQDFIKTNESFVDNCVEKDGYYSKSKVGYLDLRESYNNFGYLSELFILQTRSNSNMVRFNKQGEFNMPYGERNRFEEDRLIQHKELLIKGTVDLHNEDFGDLIEDYLSQEDLSDYVFYLDSPYYNTTAVYNEAGGWTENDNISLFEYCVELHQKGAKVVMSNVFENRGVKHQGLVDWCEDNKHLFDVYHLNASYGNTSFRKSDKITDEVLIVSKGM